MNVVRVAFVGGLLLAAACDKKQPAGGLPPATAWQGSAAPPPGPSMGGAPHGAMGGDPHAGMGLPPGHGAAPAPVGNPDHVIMGTVQISEALRAAIPPGTTIWVYAKRPDPNDPEGQRMPVASDKVPLDAAGTPFLLSEASAMAIPGALQGELIVSARSDLDGDVMTRQAGEYIGYAKVTAPAKEVVVTIDRPVTPRAAPAMPPMGGGAPSAMPPGHP